MNLRRIQHPKFNIQHFVCATILLFTTNVKADEGMWMPQQIPALSAELKERGLKIDPASFADLTGFPMGAIVHLGNCSASFVSPEGLMVTNHHCVTSALQFNSTPERDYLMNGFLAKSKADEVGSLPDARVWVTTAIDDVTAEILGSIPAKTKDGERLRMINRRRRQMTIDCEKQGNVRCQVREFFDGGQYLKITAMEIRDVRLVYAPALGVGNYGDEIDNWMWPRHTGDFSFLRAYVGPDGKPADRSAANVPYRPRHFMKISTRDLDAGDLVMLAGFPGRTYRHVSVDEVRNAEEFALPTSVAYRKALLEILQRRSAESREIALRNASRIASLENYMKKHTGVLEAMKRSGAVAYKEAEEKKLREAIAGDAKLTAEYEAAAAELRKLLAEQRRTRQRDTLAEWLLTASPMLTQADRLYRLSLERTKDDLDRADDFTDRDRNRLKGTVARTRRSIDPGSDRAGLRHFLLLAAELPADQRIAPVDDALKATGKETREEQVDALLDRLYSGTKIGDAATEEATFEEPTAKLLARGDSFILFAESLKKWGKATEERETAFQGALTRIRPVMLAALRVARGGHLYPDANGTLRVGFGEVAGYTPRDGVRYGAQTVVQGLFEKEKGVIPFKSPARLLEQARAKNFGPYVDPDLGTLPVGFASSNVVTNGASGSATINAWGELCGLAFDSNWEGVGSDYVVENEITRSVHVDSRYMLWVMDAVDGADNLLREMGIEPVIE
jgi:hypothetical protein